MKKNKFLKIILIIFMINFSAYSQFEIPEIKIITPNLIEPQYSYDIFKVINRPIKTSLFKGKLKEYDREGNLIKETEKDKFYSKVTINNYKKGLLIEQKKTVVSNQSEITAINEKEEKVAKSRGDKEYGIISSEVDEFLYSATLDKKGRIIIFTTQTKSLNKNTNKTTQIKYSKDRIIEISSKDKIETFSYNNKLLVSQYTVKKNNTTNFDLEKEYVFDKNNNLIYIKKKEIFGDKVTIYVTDSVHYDDKNRIVLVGNSSGVKKFEYDDKNRIIKISIITRNYPDNVKVCEYENDFLKKITFYTPNKKLNTEIKNEIVYNYDNDKLINYEFKIDEIVSKKGEYKYNGDLLINSKEFILDTKKIDFSENAFKLVNEINYIYKDDKLIIKDNHGFYKETTFY